MWEHGFSIFYTSIFCIFLHFLVPFFLHFVRLWPLCSLETRATTTKILLDHLILIQALGIVHDQTPGYLLSAEIIFEDVEKWKISCLKQVEKWGILKFECGGNCLMGPARLSPTPALNLLLLQQRAPLNGDHFRKLSNFSCYFDQVQKTAPTRPGELSWTGFRCGIDMRFFFPEMGQP